MLKKAAIFLTIFALMTLLFLLPIKSHADQAVLINEIYTPTGSDWVELYNPTPADIDLTNWTLSDSDSHSKTISGSIPTMGFASFSLGNYLNSDGDSVILKDASGTQIDQFTYNANPGGDFSFGRSPDGGSFSLLTPTTQNQSNNSSSSSPISTSSPTPSATPGSTPNPSPSPTATPGTTFSVSGVPSNINSDDVFSATVNLSLPESSNSTIYLKGAFYKDGSSNYFGKTLVSGIWVKNSVTYSSQLKITTDGSGNWSGLIQIMPDDADSGFDGTDSYQFKVARYNDSGSLNWSNISTINITATDSSTEAGSSPTPDPSPASPSATPKVLGISKFSKISPSPKVATISGFFKTEPPSKTIVASSKSFNWYLIIGILTLLIGLGTSAIKPLNYNEKKLKISQWLSNLIAQLKQKGLPLS